MNRLGISLGAVLAALPLAAPAQDFMLDDIVVTANRVLSELARTGVSVSVVARGALDKAGDVSLATYLSRMPGVSVSAQGAFGSPTNLRIRGADQRYIAVYIDGVKVSDPSGVQTAFDFGSLMAGDIGRIEVLRGSQSALYGGSAVGGVISITTRAAEAEGTTQSVAVEGGAHGTLVGRYSLAQKTGALDASLSLTHLRTDGFSAAAGGTEPDGAEATRLSFAARYRVSDALTLGGSFFAQRTRLDYDGYNDYFTALIDKNNVQRKEEAGARLFAELATGSTDHVFEVSTYRIGREFDQEGDIATYDGNRLSFGWQATTTISDRLSLVYGVDTMQEQARYTNLPGGRADTRISGAFGQVVWAPDATLDLTASARVDDNSAFGTFPTGRLAMAWRPAEGTTIRAAAATGFRAPSIDERFGDYPDSQFVGNPDLTPEESTSYEIGVEQALAGGAVVSATAFVLNIDNLISYQSCPLAPDYSCLPGTRSTLVNFAGQSRRQGVELSATVPLGDRATLAAAYTYTDARRPDGARIGLVPLHDLTLTLEGPLADRVTGTLAVQHVAGRLDDFATGPMADYTLVNAGVTYDMGHKAEAYLRVENLLDEVYQLSNGYATSRRAVYVGLRATF